MLHEFNQPKASIRLRLIGLIILLIAIAVAVTGIVSRINHEKILKQVVIEQDVVRVSVFTPQLEESQQSIILPGSVSAYTEAPIYARVGGYLKSWSTDIGSHVKAGQLLGIIDTPEIDQQIHKAEADLAKAEANYELATISAKRWENLLVSDSVSHQDADEKVSDAKAKKAIVNALQAELDSLLAQQSFNHITAPFDGVVTDRKTDIGMLINPGSNGGQPLFHVAKIDKLRVYIEVPQSFSAFIKPGLTAELHFPEHPTRIYQAKLVSTSNSIHQDSRTLSVELSTDNKSGEILPGSYTEVHFTLPTKGSIYQLPSDSILFRKNGMEVATVNSDNKVVLKPIKIGRDLGTTLEVLAGIGQSDKIIDSPPDSLAQGDKVTIVHSAITDTNKQVAGIK